MLNAAFEQWRVAIIRAERQRNFSFVIIEASTGIQGRLSTFASKRCVCLKSPVNFALLWHIPTSFPVNFLH